MVDCFPRDTSVAKDCVRRQNDAMRSILKWFVFFSVFWIVAAFISAPANATRDTLGILILNSYDENSAPYFRPTEVFEKKLQENYPGRIAFQHIDLGKKGGRIHSNY